MVVGTAVGHAAIRKKREKKRERSVHISVKAEKGTLGDLENFFLEHYTVYWSHLGFICKKCYSLIVRATPSCILCIKNYILQSFDFILFSIGGNCLKPRPLPLSVLKPSWDRRVHGNWGSTVVSRFGVSCGAEKTCLCS